MCSGIKERFTKELVLIAPDLDKKMRMEVYVSDYAIEEVLSIECEDGQWRPVAYLSKSLNEMERNYEIYDKEILVVIRDWELETSIRGYKVQIWDLNWSQKLRIFYESVEIKL